MKKIEQTFQECLEILKKKDADYCQQGELFSNFKSAQLVGVSPERAVLVRVMDKLSRISNLIDKEGEVDESLEDSIHDCINYLAILKELRR